MLPVLFIFVIVIDKQKQQITRTMLYDMLLLFIYENNTGFNKMCSEVWTH